MNIKKIVLFVVISFILGFIFKPSLSFSSNELTIDTTKTNDVYMLKGELQNLTVSSLTRLSIVNPDISDIVSANDKEIVLIGKEMGQTVLFIWDESGKRALTIHVYGQNLQLVKERLENLFKSTDITGITLEPNEKEGKVIVTGFVSEDKKAQFDQIIQPVADNILNLTKSENVKDLIQVDLQITELSTTLFKTMGIDWTAGSGFALSYPESLPKTDGTPADFFKIGDFNRTTALLATVNALVREGKGKILSQPKLVVVNGEEASFLVGGQIPIRTTTSSTTGTQENISFKDYGISMNITPKIINEKIDLTVSAEISDIDSANAVGQDVAFSTRSTQTKLYLDDNQTIVIAGLIKTNRGVLIKRIPFISKIPLVGLAFRSKATPSADTDTEVVISLTPHILTDRVKEAKLKKEQKEAQMSIPVVETTPTPAAETMPSDSSESATVNTSNEPNKDFIVENKWPENIPPAVDEVINNSAAQNIDTSMPVSSEDSTPSASQADTTMQNYMQSIQERLTRSIHYPDEALNYGWEGTVKLNLLILRDGTLAMATIKESSGYDIFDQDAVDVAKRIAPYDPFPSESTLQELEITIPIVYSLQNK